MVKLLAFIGVVIGLLDLAPTEPVSTMMAADTAEATADTDPEGSDSGAADTGELPDESDTGSAGGDTGSESNDTGSESSDTGQPDTGSAGDADAAPKYSAAELAGEKGGCATAAAPTTGPAAWLIAVLGLVVTGRRRQ
ncbi:MAG: MYXO-CTERM sorting domain-containing protein [Myxococcota bacterium]|nr:MYXO-CTERM sorting domain-containing protein [Myxococcota bacterium]